MSENAEFTKKMRKSHTIYMPDMLHYHNALLKAAFRFAGYSLDIVPEYHELSPQVSGMINSDYCTCATGIVGNLLTMLEDPHIDTREIAFLEPQAGGACRAGNYYNLIISCLKKAGRKDIPVISLNWKGMERHRGFRISLRLIASCVAAVCYSDLLMTLLLQVRPYEKRKGETQELYENWIEILERRISRGRKLFFRKGIYRSIVQDFIQIELDDRLVGKKRKVGIAGEIYIKFSPIGNRHLEEFLEQNGCEYRLGEFLNYCIFVMHTDEVSLRLNKESGLKRKVYGIVIKYLLGIQRDIHRAMDDGHFSHDSSFMELKEKVKNVISEDYVIGDGWLVAGEVMDHISKGYDRVLMVHPFGCLVSHVGSRGVLKKIHRLYPKAQVHSVEYDHEQSETMRESRILLAIH